MTLDRAPEVKKNPTLQTYLDYLHSSVFIGVALTQDMGSKVKPEVGLSSFVTC